MSRPTVSDSTELTTGFDKPVLSYVEGLMTNGWSVEGGRRTVGWLRLRLALTQPGPLGYLADC
jgi:hypothetical protein